MIREFRGQYSFLSNFFKLPFPIVVENIGYDTVEHYYIAMKTLDNKERLKIATMPPTGLKAYGKGLQLREDWDSIRLSVMEFGLREKFKSNFRIRRLLMKTGDLFIQEGNFWNDKFWGICLKTGNGKNHLGQLLMKIRDEYLEAATKREVFK